MKIKEFFEEFEPRFFFYLYSHKIFFWFFVAFFLVQIMFWKTTESVKPKFDIVPPAPNQYVVSAVSLGDKEFLFRVFSSRLQNSGDVFAGFLALSKYDYSRIYDWLTVLDGLNNDSRLPPSLATYYYAQTQYLPDTKYIVNYLDEHASQDIDKHWWWLFQAIYIAKNNLKDLDLALELAYKLSKNKAEDAPIWTRQMPAFVHEERGALGDDCLAFKVIQDLIKEGEDGKTKMNPKDLDFMKFFIEQRLAKLKKGNFDPTKCKDL